jgi:2-oxoglutarate ferredoxin oxidoreductase subunit beta
MEELMQGEGFRFLEIISQCPTHFEKDSKRTPTEILDFYKENSIPVAEAKEAYDGQLGSRLTVGALAERKRDGYMRRLEAVERKLRADMEGEAQKNAAGTREGKK